MATIKLSNSVLLDCASLKIAIDPSNLLVDLGGGTEWTATQDCWAYPRDSGITLNCKYDDITINSTNQTIVRKGTKIKGASRTMAFGFK